MLLRGGGVGVQYARDHQKLCPMPQWFRPFAPPRGRTPVSAPPIDVTPNVSGVAAMTPPGSLVRVRDCIETDRAQCVGGESSAEGPTLAAFFNQAM